MTELAMALAADDAAEVRGQIRGLVGEVRLVPEAGWPRVVVRGALGAILALAEGRQNAKSPGVLPGLSRSKSRWMRRPASAFAEL